ncbi:MAG TPA: hypothetical protein VGL59_21860, partial [Polyangia bacterium]|jgi:hypothetical protein
VLSSRGGGAEMVSFDPRPKIADEDEAPTTAPRKRGAAVEPAMRTPTPPPTAANDITGGLRVELADEGISYLQKALALRPRYSEAMTYLGLLERQKSFAFFADPAQWQAAVDRSRGWQEKASAARSGGKP